MIANPNDDPNLNLLKKQSMIANKINLINLEKKLNERIAQSNDKAALQQITKQALSSTNSEPKITTEEDEKNMQIQQKQVWPPLHLPGPAVEGLVGCPSSCPSSACLFLARPDFCQLLRWEGDPSFPGPAVSSVLTQAHSAPSPSISPCLPSCLVCAVRVVLINLSRPHAQLLSVRSEEHRQEGEAVQAVVQDAEVQEHKFVQIRT